MLALFAIACGGRAQLSAPDPIDPGHAGSAGFAGADANGGVSGIGAAGSDSAAGAGVGGSFNVPWRRTSDPFCAPFSMFPRDVIDLWSDPSGVFLLIDAELFENPGAGWSNLPASSGRSAFGGLAGFPGGSLVRYGGVASRCGIEFVDRAGAILCSGAVEPIHLHVVDEKLAYAVYGSRVLIFDGVHWKQLGPAFPGDEQTRQVWADEQTLLVATSRGVRLAVNGGPLELVSDLGGGDVTQGASAVWGFGPNNLWFGNSVGQLVNFNGVAWSAKPVSNAGECAGVRHLWGANGQLFVATANRVLASGTAGFQPIFEVPCEEGSRVWSIWGNHPKEVFVAYETKRQNDACGNVSLAWYDGLATHAL